MGDISSAVYNLQSPLPSLAGIPNSFPFVNTQSRSIRDQLRSGIRFLDLRAALNSTKTSLDMYHGPVYLGLSLRDVIDDCITFLTENPTECLILSIKKEHTSDDDATFSSMVRSLTTAMPTWWYTTDAVPTLAQVLGTAGANGQPDQPGKLVLVRRYADPDPNPIGIDAYSGWPDNTTGPTTGQGAVLQVQDQYYLYYSPNPFDVKWQAIEGMLVSANPQAVNALAAAPQAIPQGNLALNLLSATGLPSKLPPLTTDTTQLPSFYTPGEISDGQFATSVRTTGVDGMNAKLIAFLNQQGNAQGRYGIVLLDLIYPNGWPVVQQLIDSNTFLP